MFTAVFNLTLKDYSFKKLRLNYFLALSFGFIHGMGFANTIRYMLSKQQNIALPLLSFNLGLEMGQIFLITFFLACGYVFLRYISLPQKIWVWALSIFTFYMAINMAMERWPV
jgi:hypothetical protein